MPFVIYPALDLRHGRVVRLKLGDPTRQTVYSDDPVEIGRRWLDAGAGWLHVVNLDGAFADEGHKIWLALEELAKLDARIQFGGGLRGMPDIETAMTLGVSRVVLGTTALENPALVSASIERFGDNRVAVGIDAHDNRVRVRGWQQTTDVSPTELALAMRAIGVKTTIYTDISRDGMLGGVNVAATAALAAASGLAIIASGGVSSLDDIVRLRQGESAGISGVIIGRALYEGQVDLAAAIALAATGESHAG